MNIKYICIPVAYLFSLMSCMAGLSKEQTAERYPIIPLPAEVVCVPGSFVMDSHTSVVLKTKEEGIRQAADFLIDIVNQSQKVRLNHAFSASKGNVIFFVQSDTITAPEGYRLDISPRTITISSRNGVGAFYAVQTLRQLLPVACEKGTAGTPCSIRIPAGKIYDAPRFVYRGVMLDVARYFFPVDFIRKYIDVMALYKFNTLHLHLTDDQGWRVEIKSYPRLTEIGAWRKQSIVGHKKDVPRKYDGKPHGGFYTQQELKDLVAYANQRHIQLIPEIEMPGHSQAVLAAYPQLACKDQSYDVSCDWGVHKEVLCTKEETFIFLQAVLTEIFEIFPGKYIHIGGDECPKDRWKECAVCQANIKRLGLKDEHELQSYFIQRMEQFVNQHGKSIIGWDEILEGGLAPNATVMSWRGQEGGVKAAQMKHPVIMTPRNYCYLDYYQSADKMKEPLAISGYLPLDTVYSYNPTGLLSQEESKYMMGAQANVWTEYIATPEHAEYMSFPRAIALSEVNWSLPDRKNYADFMIRLKHHAKMLDAMGVNYAKHFLSNNQ